ncbi:hypothetical protein BB558_003203 [Smittium angustum]|uniref:Uncharacterized protein n=1 Tax=Smittium angustum TaxID=133377 RepID=A0A2U1J6P9_SMIAN|nr:hypothetical protein BB558_003203 [Smittium angustum]
MNGHVLRLIIFFVVITIVVYLTPMQHSVPSEKYNAENSTYLEYLARWKTKNNQTIESWKISDSDVEKIKTFDTKFKVDTIPLPQDKNYTDLIGTLREQYLIMVPISKQESIGFFKNVYSDLNILIVCDADDNRSECDLQLNGNYEYKLLSHKIKEMLSVACNNLKGYKMYAKMDFDAYLKKDYVANLIKFLIDNNERRIYYGNPIIREDHLFMSGNFYAFTEQLFNDYCSCKIPRPDVWNEDYWFGKELEKCVKSKNLTKTEGTLHIINDQSKILHKKYTDIGVSLKLGRNNKLASNLNKHTSSVLYLAQRVVSTVVKNNQKNEKEAAVTVTASNKMNISGSSGAGSTLDIINNNMTVIGMTPSTSITLFETFINLNY